MEYSNIIEGIFLSRPNRFIAICNVDGKVTTCHVKNTGRCRELLLPNSTVYLEESQNTSRKTKYDLIGVKKGDILINMDSQAPNKVVAEWLYSGRLFKDIINITPEKTYNNSRFDFFVERKSGNAFIEVKGVTLEDNGVFMFPDAPTTRGVKHISELIEAKKNGYEAYIIFVIQSEKAKYFTPNYKTHKEFGKKLKESVINGVKAIALTCNVTKNTLSIKEEIKIVL